jgi:hypothetical protein
LPVWSAVSSGPVGWMAHPVVSKSATATIIFCFSIKTCIVFPFFSVFLRIGFLCLTP